MNEAEAGCGVTHLLSEHWEAEPGGLTQVPEMPVLHSEFRASLGYRETQFEKQTNKQMG